MKCLLYFGRISCTRNFVTKFRLYVLLGYNQDRLQVSMIKRQISEAV